MILFIHLIAKTSLSISLYKSILKKQAIKLAFTYLPYCE